MGLSAVTWIQQGLGRSYLSLLNDWFLMDSGGTEDIICSSLATDKSSGLQWTVPNPSSQRWPWLNSVSHKKKTLKWSRDLQARGGTKGLGRNSERVGVAIIQIYYVHV